MNVSTVTENTLRKSGPAASAPNIHELWKSGLFLSVLAAKIAASFFFSSAYLSKLFTPFINWYVTSGFKNPWEFFYHLNELRVFPYPTVMLWVMSIPRVLFYPFLSHDWQVVTPLHLAIMRIPLLGFDLMILFQLLKFFPTQQKRLLRIYWCSPIVFFINYVHGQLDIVPTAIFFSAVFLLISERYWGAFLLMAVAAATKTHIVLAIPFACVFLYKKKIPAVKIISYLACFAAAYALLIAPYFYSEGFRQIVFHSPEQRKFFDFVIPVSTSLNLVVCPTVVALLFIKFSSYKKLNREILLMFLGIIFAALVVFVPPMPGWFLWSLPFLIYFYMHNKDYSRAPFILYNAIYIFYFAFFFEKSTYPFQNAAANLPVADLALSTVMSSVGFIAFWMFNLGVRKNEELRVSENPLLIGIGGDSASGKHTLLKILRILVGKSRSIPILGDDFHKWERGNQNWSVYTHLNPQANELHKNAEMAVALKDGNAIQMVHYDHSTGKFSNPETIESNKFIFFVGLHPFYLKKMRDLIPVKIFMEPDEALRRYWKIQRDVQKRGYGARQVVRQIELREEDKQKYIAPQKEFADLIIRYSPAIAVNLDNYTGRIPVKTTFTLDNSIDIENLVRFLSKVETLEVEHVSTVHTQELTVKGTIGAREVMNIASQLELNFDELFINTRAWLKDHKGITQLVFVLLYNHKMKVR